MKLNTAWTRRRPLPRGRGGRGRPGSRGFGNWRGGQTFGGKLVVHRLHDDGNEARVEIAIVLKCLSEGGGTAVCPQPADDLHGAQDIAMARKAKINDNARKKLVLARQTSALETQLPRQGPTSLLPMGTA